MEDNNFLNDKARTMDATDKQCQFCMACKCSPETWNNKFGALAYNQDMSGL